MLVAFKELSILYALNSLTVIPIILKPASAYNTSHYSNGALTLEQHT